MAAPRPFWMSEPCPAWCAGGHADDDHPDDRTHYSRWNSRFQLVLMEGDLVRGNYHVSELDVSMSQGYREIAARVRIERDDSKCLDLTVGEARALADQLTKAADLAAGQWGAE